MGEISEAMPNAVRFVLDGKVKEIGSIDPTRTVLEYLRNDERRCGTKEGCAEGDCGACTVVLGELEGGRVRWRAVNACLLFVPALDGKALLTVESACDGGELHPVQRALVECHASQCGFCTPGFVMSLLALYESEPAPSRERVEEVLAGNLCRCTGYRPIVDAAEAASASGGGPRLAAQEAHISALLASIARDDTLALEHEGRRWFAPRTLEALAGILERHPDARLVAGATDLGVEVTKQHRHFDTLVSLASIPALRTVSTTETHLELGAAVSYTDALGALADHHPSFAALVRRLGSQQIRNVGTLGGNVANASPIGDTLPALVALDATVVLRRGAATRELPLDEFFLGYRRTALAPGEIVERIRIPLARPGQTFRVYKVSKRRSQDISAVCGAFRLDLVDGRVREVRICYGGMAAIPKRARGCEDALRGREWSEATVAAALPALDAELAPISDARASAGYRRLVARNLLRKLHAETGAPAPRARTVWEGA
jgi:xanthine dehydrogenase small subunit